MHDGGNTVAVHQYRQHRAALFDFRAPGRDIRYGEPYLRELPENQVLRRKQDGLADKPAGGAGFHFYRAALTGITMKLYRLEVENKLKCLDRRGVPGIDFHKVNAILLFYRVNAEQPREIEFTGDYLADTAPL